MIEKAGIDHVTHSFRQFTRELAHVGIDLNRHSSVLSQLHLALLLNKIFNGRLMCDFVGSRLIHGVLDVLRSYILVSFPHHLVLLLKRALARCRCLWPTSVLTLLYQN